MVLFRCRAARLLSVVTSTLAVSIRSFMIPSPMPDLASFLGCSPYQYAMRSSDIGFAGPGVIKETTGMDVEPHYHSAYKALARGHIQGVWDRREARANLHQVLLTMGGRNLYYR